MKRPNYFTKLSELELEVCSEAIELLRKTGGAKEEDEIDFFTFDNICRLEITEFDANGIVVGGMCNGSSISSLVNNATILLTDAISLVDSLRERV